MQSPVDRFAPAQASLDDDKQGLIPKAGQLLTTLAFCRQQAEILHKCQEKGERCRSENDAFMRCATEAAPKVIETMVKIAIKHCPEEVAAHQSCIKQKGRQKCQAEDLAAMWWASREVMKAAAEETRAR